MYRDSRGYYYKSVRQGDRITKEYVGNGLTAHLAAQLDEYEQLEQAERAGRERADLERWQAVEEEIKAFDTVVAAVVQDTLQSAGYHQHKRGGMAQEETEQHGTISNTSSKQNTRQNTRQNVVR